MKIIGLTGGIGSGKTTVAKLFKSLGVPIYIADDEAKALMNRSKVIKRKLIALFGPTAYKDDVLNRDYLAKSIFSNKALLNDMNAIVHPKVAQHFKRWLKRQDSEYVIKESAIIFEHDKAKEFHKVILVVADSELRIQRILSREGMTREKAISIMDNQLPDKIKKKQADFIIYNDNLSGTNNQVVKIHNSLMLSNAKK